MMDIKSILKIRNAAKRMSFGGHFMLPLRILRHVFKGARGTVRIDDFDGNASLDLALSEHMQSRIFWAGYYSREIVELLNEILLPGMTAIDVGGNLGEITLVAARRVGIHGTVITFEPVSALADTLRQNTRRNGLTQVEVIQQGLSDRDGEVMIYNSCGQGRANEEHSGLSSIYPSVTESKSSERISITTLDQFLERKPLNRVDLIKIDIEGSELPCLRGAERTLQRFTPLLIIEVQRVSAAAAGYEQAEILKFLETLGYDFQQIGRRGRLTPIDALSLNDYQNVLCTPGSRTRPT